MKQAHNELEVMTNGPDLIDITGPIEKWLSDRNVSHGLLTLFVRHTSASLLISENADPSVQTDLKNFFARLVSRDQNLYRHGAEGPDDMPAHIRTALTQTTVSIPVSKGALILGTWQGIYLFEHRDKPHKRKVYVHLIGE